MELPDLAAAALSLEKAVAKFRLSTPDYSRFCDTLEAFVKGMPDANDKTTSTAIIGRMMNNVKMGFYPTDPEHVKLITKGIEFPDGVTTNLLDPCCGDGVALRLMATGNNCYAYGVELDERRAEEAQTRLHRVAIGSYFSARISHEAFHVLFLNLLYLSVIEEGGHTGRDEKRFLVNSLCHLMIGGLLVYIIPYYRLTSDIARILCDNFERLSVYKFCGKEFQRFRQVAVLGIRKPRGDGSQEVSGLLRQVQDADKIPELTELPEKSYPLIITNLLPLLFSFFSNCSNFFVTSCITPISVSNCSWGQSMFFLKSANGTIAPGFSHKNPPYYVSFYFFGFWD